jgi:hypothetical protein
MKNELLLFGSLKILLHEVDLINNTFCGLKA